LSLTNFLVFEPNCRLLKSHKVGERRSFNPPVNDSGDKKIYVKSNHFDFFFAEDIF